MNPLSALLALIGRPLGSGDVVPRTPGFGGLPQLFGFGTALPGLSFSPYALAGSPYASPSATSPGPATISDPVALARPSGAGGSGLGANAFLNGALFNSLFPSSAPSPFASPTGGLATPSSSLAPAPTGTSALFDMAAGLPTGGAPSAGGGDVGAASPGVSGASGTFAGPGAGGISGFGPNQGGFAQAALAGARSGLTGLGMDAAGFNPGFTFNAGPFSFNPQLSDAVALAGKMALGPVFSLGNILGGALVGMGQNAETNQALNSSLLSALNMGQQSPIFSFDATGNKVALPSSISSAFSPNLGGVVPGLPADVNANDLNAAVAQGLISSEQAQAAQAAQSLFGGQRPSPGPGASLSGLTAANIALPGNINPDVFGKAAEAAQAEARGVPAATVGPSAPSAPSAPGAPGPAGVSVDVDPGAFGLAAQGPSALSGIGEEGATGAAPGEAEGEGDAGGGGGDGGGGKFCVTYTLRHSGLSPRAQRRVLAFWARQERHLVATSRTGATQLAAYRRYARRIVAQLTWTPELKAYFHERIVKPTLTRWTPARAEGLRRVYVGMVYELGRQTGISIPAFYRSAA